MIPIVEDTSPFWADHNVPRADISMKNLRISERNLHCYRNYSRENLREYTQHLEDEPSIASRIACTASFEETADAKG